MFDCDAVLQLHTWHHVAVVISKTGLRGMAKVKLFLNGNLQGTQKVGLCLRVCLLTRVTGNLSIA